MEQRPILSNVLHCIQYDKHPKNYHSLHISVANKCRTPYIKEEERDILELDFGYTPDKLKEEYLDVYKGVQSEISSTTRFDENSDLSTTYLGKVDKSKNNKIKLEESFPISEQGYTMVKLLDGTEYRIQKSVNHSCQNHIICTASHFTLCLNLHPKCREFK